MNAFLLVLGIVLMIFCSMKLGQSFQIMRSSTPPKSPIKDADWAKILEMERAIPGYEPSTPPDGVAAKRVASTASVPYSSGTAYVQIVPSFAAFKKQLEVEKDELRRQRDETKAERVARAYRESGVDFETVTQWGQTKPVRVVRIHPIPKYTIDPETGKAVFQDSDHSQND